MGTPPPRQPAWGDGLSSQQQRDSDAGTSQSDAAGDAYMRWGAAGRGFADDERGGGVASSSSSSPSPSSSSSSSAAGAAVKSDAAPPGSAWPPPSSAPDWGEAQGVADWDSDAARTDEWGGDQAGASFGGAYGTTGAGFGSREPWASASSDRGARPWGSAWGSGAGAAAGYGGAAPAGGVGEEEYGAPPPPLAPSDITRISPREADLLLPLTPNGEQATYYRPKTLQERVVQVLGSLGASVALSKSAALAGPVLLFPIWGPWLRAGLRNLELHMKQFKAVGLWRAQVLRIDINRVPYAYSAAAPSPSFLGDTVAITVGDPWAQGARAELLFPALPGCEEMLVGEPAELMVLARDDTFTEFKVVREVYLPQSGMWLSEYPFVDRDAFLDISLAIERSRQQGAVNASAAASSTSARGGDGGGTSAAASPPSQQAQYGSRYGGGGADDGGYGGGGGGFAYVPSAASPSGFGGAYGSPFYADGAFGRRLGGSYAAAASTGAYAADSGWLRVEVEVPSPPPNIGSGRASAPSGGWPSPAAPGPQGDSSVSWAPADGGEVEDGGAGAGGSQQQAGDWPRWEGAQRPAPAAADTGAGGTAASGQCRDGWLEAARAGSPRRGRWDG